MAWLRLNPTPCHQSMDRTYNLSDLSRLLSGEKKFWRLIAVVHTMQIVDLPGLRGRCQAGPPALLLSIALRISTLWRPTPRWLRNLIALSSGSTEYKAGTYYRASLSKALFPTRNVIIITDTASTALDIVPCHFNFRLNGTDTCACFSPTDNPPLLTSFIASSSVTENSGILAASSEFPRDSGLTSY